MRPMYLVFGMLLSSSLFAGTIVVTGDDGKSVSYDTKEWSVVKSACCFKGESPTKPVPKKPCPVKIVEKRVEVPVIKEVIKEVTKEVTKEVIVDKSLFNDLALVGGYGPDGVLYKIHHDGAVTFKKGLGWFAGVRYTRGFTSVPVSLSGEYLSNDSGAVAVGYRF